MNFKELLQEFMERTVAYGFTEGARELAATAKESGLLNVARLLTEYAAAVAAGDKKAAAKYFCMLHIFTEA